ncbi:MAG: ribonuclease III [Clostridiales bacterium]|nr:ribonuclease III [Clostridiales bacterium]
MEKDLGNDFKQLAFASYIREKLNIPEVDIHSYSPLTLAYIGDAIYDLIIRTIAVENGNAPVNTLHKRVSKLVQASAQADLYFSIKDQLTEEEMSVFRRGRNAKSVTSAKNASIGEYRIATGVEALIGYLYLCDQTDRLLELLKPIINKW